MTEVFYAAVKGSLHANDSGVFGLKNEELFAIQSRFPFPSKPVVNGYNIKANPLDVINSLAELGYRVACSSGDTEIVWTLKREALLQDRVASPATSPLASPPSGRQSAAQKSMRNPARPVERIGPKLDNGMSMEEHQETGQMSPKRVPYVQKGEPIHAVVAGRPFVVQPSMSRTPVKQVERIGTKPEDWALLEELNNDADDKITSKHISSLERIEPGQKIILKTNLSSEFNPLSRRPGPIDCPDGPDGDFIVPRRRSISAPPRIGNHHRFSFHCHVGRHSYISSQDSLLNGSPADLSYCSKDIPCGNDLRLKHTGPSGLNGEKPFQRQGLRVYLEDIIASNVDVYGDRTTPLEAMARNHDCVFFPATSQEESSCKCSSKQEVSSGGNVGLRIDVPEQHHSVHPTENESQLRSSAVSSFDVSISPRVACIQSNGLLVDVPFTISMEGSGNPVDTVNIPPTSRLMKELESAGDGGPVSISGHCDGGTASHCLCSTSELEQIEILSQINCKRQNRGRISTHPQHGKSKCATVTISPHGSVIGEYFPCCGRNDKFTAGYDRKEKSYHCRFQGFHSHENSVQSAESSYPDLTRSDHSRSRGTLSTTDSSPRVCYHGYNLNTLAYREKTYHVLNNKTDIAQSKSTLDRFPSSRFPEQNRKQCHNSLESRRTPRSNLTLNSSNLCDSIKLTENSTASSIRSSNNGSHIDDVEPRTLQSNSSYMNIRKGKFGHQKLDDLEESDWSLISSLVDDVCGKRKGKRTELYPCT